MDVFTFSQGSSPVLMSIPHAGEYLPAELAAQMTPIAAEIGDTDWYLDRLYNFTAELNLNVIRANYSRYVIDLNRDSDSLPLYPGANNTELVPTSTFLEEPLYGSGEEPSSEEVNRRLEAYWKPYHQKIQETIGELRDRFGYVVLFDCHSIRSILPRFFEGKLPDFNLGTAAGESCSTILSDQLAAALSADDRYSLAVNGRFKGGFITRHYGSPENNIHAFQLELSLATYMDEKPDFAWREDLAEQVRPSLRSMLEAAHRRAS